MRDERKREGVGPSEWGEVVIAEIEESDLGLDSDELALLASAKERLRLGMLLPERHLNRINDIHERLTDRRA